MNKLKVTYLEELEAKKAFTHKMFCPKCKGQFYTIHHQLRPETALTWWLECNDCGYTSFESPTREIAIARWKQGNMNK